MAAGSLLMLLDDIASVLDDVATMTKVASKKTAGVLGDDLALNAQQVAGVRANRELPVVWAVARGSAVNKLVLVPLALSISILAPWAVTPLLMLGGAYLCYEGCEKIAHKFLRQSSVEDAQHARKSLPTEDDDALSGEKAKIRGAIRTDFVLSAEIITIALGVVKGQPWAAQLTVLALVAMLMTMGVYGLVAGIVRLDDLGFHLARKNSALLQGLGQTMVAATPWLMRFLAVAGTVAMFLVGGGIFVHGVPLVAHAIEAWTVGGGFAEAVLDMVLQGAVGVLAGMVVFCTVLLGQKLFQKR